jgi:hypothetical protein
MYWFSWNLVLEHFSKICQQNSRFINTWQEWRILYMKTNIHFLTYLVVSRSVLFRIRNVSGKICRENQNTHILYWKTFFENLTVYEIMWKNIVETYRPQMTTRRMRISRWIAKSTNTQSEYVILLLIHGNSGRTNAPQCHVTRTFPVLFPFITRTEKNKTCALSLYYHIW